MTDNVQNPTTPEPVVPAVTVNLDTPAAPVPVVNLAALAADQAGKVFSYEKTGDLSLDYALNFVGRLGFGPEHPAVVSATRGDFGILRAELAALGDKAPGYADVVTMAETAFSKGAEKKAAAAKAIGAYAVSASESAERWASIQKWASVNADPAEKAEINAALAAGGIQAKAAIDYLIKCHDKSVGTVKVPKAAAKSDAGTAHASTVGPLTAAEYSAEVQKLIKASGNRDIGDKPEYAALQARRVQGRKLNK